MLKNKKSRIVSIKPGQLSPEKYILTQARSLPILECIINEDWEITGMCNIIVARQHKTSNVTLGIYLVDMLCLGVKDAFYKFNIYPDEFGELKDELPDWKVCEYPLVHNIIYGAIAFAEDYGFKPHKGFSIAGAILEEDDDNIELMEMDFGMEGQPCYMQSPYDDEVKVRQILATLTHTAGEGNFKIIEEDEFDDDGVDEDDDFDEDDFADFLIEQQEENFQSYIKVFKKINKAYDTLVRTPELLEMLKQSAIGKKYKISKVELDEEKFDTIGQKEEYDRLCDLALNDEDYDKAIKGALKAIKKYPGKPVFYNILQFAYTFNEQYDEASDIIYEVYNLYPDYLFAKIYYANLMIDKNQPNNVPAVFNGAMDLSEIYPSRKVFDAGEAAGYYSCMCKYFIAVDDIDTADLYMNAIIKKGFIKEFGQTVLKLAIDELCNIKMKKIESLI